MISPLGGVILLCANTTQQEVAVSDQCPTDGPEVSLIVRTRQPTNSNSDTQVAPRSHILLPALVKGIQHLQGLYFWNKTLDDFKSYFSKMNE